MWRDVYSVTMFVVGSVVKAAIETLECKRDTLLALQEDKNTTYNDKNDQNPDDDTSDLTTA